MDENRYIPPEGGEQPSLPSETPVANPSDDFRSQQAELSAEAMALNNESPVAPTFNSPPSANDIPPNLQAAGFGAQPELNIAPEVEAAGLFTVNPQGQQQNQQGQYGQQNQYSQQGQQGQYGQQNQYTQPGQQGQYSQQNQYPTQGQQGQQNQQGAPNYDPYAQQGYQPYQQNQQNPQNQQQSQYDQNYYGSNQGNGFQTTNPVQPPSQTSNGNYDSNQGQYYNPYQYQQPTKSTSGLSVASLVLGIASIVLSCAYFLSVPMAIVGGILGVVEMAKRKKGMALAGLICSGIGLLCGLAMALIFFVMMDNMGGFMDYFGSFYDYW